MPLQPLLLFLHLSSVVIWVGGMFFAYLCLRPVAATLLDPPLRLQLWQGVFARFFVWVWCAVILVALSGFSLLAQTGMRLAPPGVHLMMTSGLVMIAIYMYVATVPYRQLSRAIAAVDWKAGGQALNRIRRLVGINLVLGLATIGFATLGRYLG